MHIQLLHMSSASVRVGDLEWTLLKRDSQALQACHMRCQRLILGISWTDRVTNAEVSSLTGLPDIKSVVTRRRHAVFSHVEQLSPDTPAHKALHMAVQLRQGTHPDASWQRPIVRLCHTWIGQLEQVTGISADQLWNTAVNRTEWAALRPSAGYRDH